MVWCTYSTAVNLPALGARTRSVAVTVLVSTGLKSTSVDGPNKTINKQLVRLDVRSGAYGNSIFDSLISSFTDPQTTWQGLTVTHLCSCPVTTHRIASSNAYDAFVKLNMISLSRGTNTWSLNQLNRHAKRKCQDRMWCSVCLCGYRSESGRDDDI